MSVVMEEEIKRWTARRKSALVLEIIQGNTTVAEAGRAFDLPPPDGLDPAGTAGGGRAGRRRWGQSVAQGADPASRSTCAM